MDPGLELQCGAIEKVGRGVGVRVGAGVKVGVGTGSVWVKGRGVWEMIGYGLVL